MRMLPVYCVLLLACGDKGESADSGLSTSSITTTTTTSTTSSTTPTVPRAGLGIDVRCDCMGGADLRVGFTLTHTVGEEVIYVGEFNSVAAASFPLTVELPAFADNDVGPLEYFQGGALLIYAYEDLDGDGLQGPGDPIIATTNRSLVFIDDGAAGLWVALDLDLAGETDPVQVGPSLGIDLIAFVPSDGVTFAGSLDAAATQPERITAASILELAGAPVNGTVLDELYTGGDFVFTVSAAPDASRVSEIGLGEPVAYEIPLAYRDDNNDGRFSLNDGVSGWACSAGLPFGLMYFPQPETVNGALTAFALGYQPGWNAVVSPGPLEPPQIIDNAAAASLTISENDCAGF